MNDHVTLQQKVAFFQLYIIGLEGTAIIQQSQGKCIVSFKVPFFFCCDLYFYINTSFITHSHLKLQPPAT